MTVNFIALYITKTTKRLFWSYNGVSSTHHVLNAARLKFANSIDFPPSGHLRVTYYNLRGNSKVDLTVDSTFIFKIDDLEANLAKGKLVAKSEGKS